jgi:ArsR family metal-binding transcriptional regulator
MEKSALDISYSADKGYERLRNKEISITIPEEGFNNDTLVMSADEAPEIGEEVDEEIENLGLPVLKDEIVEQAA